MRNSSRPYFKDMQLHLSFERMLQPGNISKFLKLTFLIQALQMLSTIDAELKLVIAGNHDFTLDPLYDYEYRKRNKLNKDKYEEATELMNGPLAKEVCLLIRCFHEHAKSCKKLMMEGSRQALHTSKKACILSSSKTVLNLRYTPAHTSHGTGGHSSMTRIRIDSTRPSKLLLATLPLPQSRSPIFRTLIS